MAKIRAELPSQSQDLYNPRRKGERTQSMMGEKLSNDLEPQKAVSRPKTTELNIPANTFMEPDFPSTRSEGQRSRRRKGREVKYEKERTEEFLNMLATLANRWSSVSCGR